MILLRPVRLQKNKICGNSIGNCGPRIRGSWETRSVRLCGLSCRFYVVPINCIAALGNIVRRISPEAIVGLRSFHGSVWS